MKDFLFGFYWLPGEWLYSLFEGSDWFWNECEAWGMRVFFDGGHEETPFGWTKKSWLDFAIFWNCGSLGTELMALCSGYQVFRSEDRSKVICPIRFCT